MTTIQPILSYYPPVLFTAPLSGKTYACGDKWYEVPAGTTLEEVRAAWQKHTRYAANEKMHALRTYKYEVQGSKGDIYTVTLHNDATLSYCTCSGFTFRKTCKHGDIAKEMHKHELSKLS